MLPTIDELRTEMGEDTLTDRIREWANCRTVHIDDDGDVWIEDPQAGHWLTEDDLLLLCGWLVDAVTV